MSYCLISPCRDEAKFIRRTLDSVLSQTVRPDRWILVDDGSTDETPDILAEYAKKYSFITVVKRSTTTRRVGPGVVEAFYEGFDLIEPNEYDYLCKLDVDLDLPPAYFETLIERMEQNPRLGTCSGKPYFPTKANKDLSFDGPICSEGCGDDMSVGMTKFYRTACFQQIGGFVHEVMWDGIDCHRCRLLGWSAISYDEPSLRFLHLRPMGSSHKGIINGRMRHGFGQYFMGTSLPFMAASAAYRMTRQPYFIGGLCMLIGYVKSMLLRVEQYDDPEFRRFLRRYQWLCLTRGKAIAVEEVKNFAKKIESDKPPMKQLAQMAEEAV